MHNRNLAFERLADRRVAALEVRRPRRATRPSAGAKRRRVDAKKRRGDVKQARRRPTAED